MFFGCLSTLVRHWHSDNIFFLVLCTVCRRRLGFRLVPEAGSGGGGFLWHHLRHACRDQQRPWQSPETCWPEEDLQSCEYMGGLTKYLYTSIILKYSCEVLVLIGFIVSYFKLLLHLILKANSFTPLHLFTVLVTLRITWSTKVHF